MEVDEIMMFPVSAKMNIGIDDLKNTILEDLKAESSRILEESTKLKLHDIVISALSQITFYRNALQMTGVEFDKKFAEIQSFFGQLHDETAMLPAALKANAAVCEAHSNDVKNRLTAKVKELFGIDYHYEIERVSDNSVKKNQQDDIVAQVDEICDSLNKTLNTVFMHREENTYVVARRINNLNRLVRKLVQMRDEK